MGSEDQPERAAKTRAKLMPHTNSEGAAAQVQAQARFEAE